MSNLSPLLTTLKENLESLNPSNSNLQNHLTKTPSEELSVAGVTSLTLLSER